MQALNNVFEKGIPYLFLNNCILMYIQDFIKYGTENFLITYAMINFFIFFNKYVVKTH